MTTSKTSANSSTGDNPQNASEPMELDSDNSATQIENASGEVNDESRVTNSNFELETMKNKTEEGKTSNKSQELKAATSSSAPDVKSTPLTATVFLAAPRLKGHRLAIIGRNIHLGEWENPVGSFKHITQINDDITIFKGVVPVPSYPHSSFKFVHVDERSNNFTYEGGGPYDNRTNLLLPDSWNFFIFKLEPATGIIRKIQDGLLNFFRKPETKKKIAMNFFDIIFNHVAEKILPNWVDAYKFVSVNLLKIRDEIGDGAPVFFQDFSNRWLAKPGMNFDRLLLLVVGASKMQIVSGSTKNEIRKHSRGFSLHLKGLNIFNHWDLTPIFVQLANLAGPDYWWIFFHINRHVESLQKISSQEMSESIVKTLESIPELFLENREITSRVVDYLFRWNDIDQLYGKLETTFAQKNANHQQLLNSFFVDKLLTHTTCLDNLIKVLQSKFLKEAYENGLSRSKLPDLDLSQELEVMDIDMFDQFIKNFLNKQKKLSNNMIFAMNTPDFLLPVVRDIIEDLIASRTENNLNFDRDDYCFFADQLENVQLDHFPEAKQYIEAKLMEMTRNYLTSSSFERIPSIKLALLGLSGMNVPLLVSSSIVDLQAAINSLPPNFFQNLQVAINKVGDLDKILKTFRQGETKNVIERLENHFEQMNKIVEKVQSHRVQLNELKSLVRIFDYLHKIARNILFCLF